MSNRIAFLIVGGPHQAFHLAPAAAALSITYPGIDVVIMSGDARSLALARRAVDYYPGHRVRLEPLSRSRFGVAISWLTRSAGVHKLLDLWRHRQVFAEMRAVVVAECTSTALRRMGVRSTRLICIPHGAGDRAVSFEPRFRHFDLILVAGEKTRTRMIESGISPTRVEVTGYVKGDLARRMGRAPARLFGDDRPVVLYNPHFRSELSSLPAAVGIVADLADDPAINLIFAPHLRAFLGAPRDTIATWKRRAVPGKVIVDLDSDHLVDMHYTTSADIYVGDVSSQVYEFLIRPRPCVFVNAHGVRWQGDPDYRFWHLGEVVAPEEVGAAVARAPGLHARFRSEQVQAVSETFATIDEPAFAAADAIVRLCSP